MNGKYVRLIVSLTAMLAALCLALAGCGAVGQTAPPVTEDFTCRVAVSYHGMALTGQLSRTVDGKLLMTFSEPASLSGVAIGWDGKTMSMELAGMSIGVDADKVPQGALIKSVLRVLTADLPQGTASEEGTVFSGEVDGTAYTFVCAPDTGLPLSLSVPEEELTVVFTEASLLTHKDAAAS